MFNPIVSKVEEPARRLNAINISLEKHLVVENLRIFQHRVVDNRFVGNRAVERPAARVSTSVS